MLVWVICFRCLLLGLVGVLVVLGRFRCLVGGVSGIWVLGYLVIVLVMVCEL